MPTYDLKNQDRFLSSGSMVHAPHSGHLTTVTDTNNDKVQETKYRLPSKTVWRLSLETGLKYTTPRRNVNHETGLTDILQIIHVLSQDNMDLWQLPWNIYWNAYILAKNKFVA